MPSDPLLEAIRATPDDGWAAALADASFRTRLRALEGNDHTITSAAVPHLLALPALERLDIRRHPDMRSRLTAADISALDAAIPHVVQ